MKAHKILVVEDETDTRNLLKKILQMEGYEILEAADGNTGYNITISRKPDLMILDISIPKINGIDLCAKLRDESVKLPIIMLTSRKQPVDKIKGMESGANDYLEKPFNINDLLRRIKIQLRTMDQARIQAEDLLQKRWEEINEGLNLISAYQRPFFHSPDVEGIKSAIHYMPFGRIGGDFYRISKLENGLVEILIGDAVGKGLGALFLMASTFTQLYRLTKTEKSPRAIFKKCNIHIRKDFKELEQYVSAFLALYNPSTRILKYSCAGHHPPILIKSTRLRHETLKGNGNFLGLFDDGKYDERVVRMERGDRIFFYTDGLLDIRDLDGKKLKFPRFYRQILKNRHLPIDKLFKILVEKCGEYMVRETDARDDLTFFFVEF